MDKTVIATSSAPAAIGPYSQGVSIPQGLVYTSGQIALVPATGAVVAGDIKAQTRQVLENIRGVLEAGGSSLDRVVKTTVFLLDMNEFGAMNEVYGQFFGGNPPARTTIQAARLPKDVRVEIEAIGLVTSQK